MSTQEFQLDTNMDHERISQIFALIQSKEDVNDKPKKKISAIDSILKQDTSNININHQIPDKEYFKVNNPELIGYTALHFASEHEEYDIMKLLLKFGADFTIKNNNGETALHLTTQYILNDLDRYWGRIQETFYIKIKIHKEYISSFIILLLSAHRIYNNVANPVNNYGISHFHIACLMNKLCIVQLFLENGVSINQAVNFDSPIVPGYTPLHFAVRYFSTETVKILIDKGADQSLKDAKKMTPLHLLIKRNIEIVDYVGKKFEEYFETNKKMIAFFIEKNTHKDDFVTDDIGFSYFHAACTLQDVEAVKKLVEEIPDINHSVNKDSPFWAGYTALHFAAHFDIKTVSYLLDKGADLFIKDCKGVTPLDICAQKYDIQDMHSIIESQAQWKNIFFSDNETNLVDFLVSMQKIDEIESFFNKVSDINMFLPFTSVLWPGYTPLHLAVFFCNSSNCFNFYEDTYAIDSRKNKTNTEKIDLCLKLGADVTTQDAYGSTAVHLAFHKNRMDIVDLLLQSQTKRCNPIDHNGLSHLHIACTMPPELENTGYISLLLNKNDISLSLKSSFTIAYKNVFDYKEYPKIVHATAGSTPLHVAVNAGNINLVEELLKFGFDVNHKNVDSYTPIHQLLAFCVNDYDFAELEILLLSKNLKNCVSSSGLSHLHVACFLNSVKAVNKLLDSGADVNATIMASSNMDNFSELDMLLAHQKLIDNSTHLPFRHINSLTFIHRYDKYTPLHFAVENFRYTNYELIDALLYRGANIFAKKANGSVILYEILMGDDTRLKEIFILKVESNSELRNFIEKNAGITMLHLACSVFDIVSSRMLLDSAVNVNALCKSDSPVWPGCTPLHVLIISFNQMNISTDTNNETLTNKVYTLAKLLLDNGANILLENVYNRTPVHESLPKYTLTKILLKHHKDYNSNPTDDRRISHFHIACMCDKVTSVKWFLKHGVDVNEKIEYYMNDYDGYTPLHIATKHKFEDIIHLLILHNADVNAKSFHKETPLHIAFSLRTTKTKYIETLLNAGAKINERNIWGLTPLEKFLKSIEDNNYRGLVNEKILLQNIVRIITEYPVCVNAFYPKTRRGLIGLALCNEENIEKILNNPLFKAVIDAPDENDVDFFGRNVIHNVVSTGWEGEKPSTKAYLFIIGKLVELGFDIDHQDKDGDTPLHVAAKIQNLPAIESLLIHGADVNIVSSTGEVPYSIKWKNYQGSGYWPIRRIFRRHFKKLSYFNLDLHPLNEEEITGIGEYFNLQISENEELRHASQILDESEKLKKMKIEPYSLTLHDFFSETGTVARFPCMMKTEREAISKFFQGKSDYLRENFPELTSILYLQYRTALTRMTLFESAIMSLNILINYELPFLCSENILKYLKTDELKKLIAANE